MFKSYPGEILQRVEELLAEWRIIEFARVKPSVTAGLSGCVSFAWAQAFYETQKV